MGPTADGPGNIALFLVPMDRGDEDIGFLAGHVAQADKLAGDIEVGDLLPKAWNGKYIPRLYPIQRFIDDFRARPGVMTVGDNAEQGYAEEGVTHLALLESEVPSEGEPWLFDQYLISHVAVLIAWCAERKTYRLLHCEGCAYSMQGWIGVMQGVWNAGQGLQGQTPSLN